MYLIYYIWFFSFSTLVPKYERFALFLKNILVTYWIPKGNFFSFWILLSWFNCSIVLLVSRCLMVEAKQTYFTTLFYAITNSYALTLCFSHHFVRSFYLLHNYISILCKFVMSITIFHCVVHCKSCSLRVF